MKEITMPKLSDTMTEGTVVVWRKAVGQQVERGEVIAEVETDKATMELEAFASGMLLEIRVDAGKTVPVGTVIGVIGEPGEAPAAGEAIPEKAAPPAKPGSSPEPASPPEPAPDLQETLKPIAAGKSSRELPAAPVVRLRARELGIDLATVTGSGPGGRILLEDLAPAKTPAPGELQARQAPAVLKPSPERGIAQPPAQGASLPSAAQPLTRMRAAIARTVSDSWRTIPHFSVTVEVRMDAAEQFRRQLKEGGTPMSLTALLVKAAARALGRFPQLNTSLQEAGIVSHPEINIGIVTRRDDGLLVPILRGCGGLPLAAVANRLAQLIERARHGQLSDTEMTGGTFAISNLGMFGVHSFVALILPPMAAVLAAGAVRDGVVVQEGRPAVARLLLLTLSADHRLVDGVYAAEFLQAVKQLLEDPARLAEE